MDVSSRVQIVQIDRFDWKYPQSVCLQTLPTIAPGHYVSTIKVISTTTIHVPVTY